MRGPQRLLKTKKKKIYEVKMCLLSLETTAKHAVVKIAYVASETWYQLADSCVKV